MYKILKNHRIDLSTNNYIVFDTDKRVKCDYILTSVDAKELQEMYEMETIAPIDQPRNYKKGVLNILLPADINVIYPPFSQARHQVRKQWNKKTGYSNWYSYLRASAEASKTPLPF